jgi:hypothetical protein
MWAVAVLGMCVSPNWVIRSQALFRGNGGVTQTAVNGGNVGALGGGGTGTAETFFIWDISGNQYEVTDPNAFMKNNSGIGVLSNQIYISADKSVYIARANVESVLIKNVVFDLWLDFFAYTFADCTNLTSAVFENVIISSTSSSNIDAYFMGCFYNCTSLVSVPTIPPLPDGAEFVIYYLTSCFENCTSLTTAPILPALPSTFIGMQSYLDNCFYNCTQLTNALIPNIPPCAGMTGAASGAHDYAGGTCPATPDTPITTLEQFKAGYNYH